LVFLALLIAVQWPFSSFLQLPAARNWVFHTNIFDYNAHRAWMHYVFTKPDAPLDFLRELCLAAAAAIVTVRLGFAWGDWMRRVRR
jgi:hypothetical protein